MNRPAATPTVLPNAVVTKFDSTVHQKQTDAASAACVAIEGD